MWNIFFGLICMAAGGNYLYQMPRENVPELYRPWWAKGDEDSGIHEFMGVVVGSGALLIGGFFCWIGISRLIHWP